jgi:lysophospholipase L1-like esterase
LIEGINDIRHDGNPDHPGRSAEEVIAAYRQIIARLHLHGVKVIGGTLTAFSGSERFDERSETARKVLNAFIRDSGEFDGVADFDRATRNPHQPEALRLDFVRDDRLHPNDAGYAAMAEAVDLSLFTSGATSCGRTHP